MTYVMDVMTVVGVTVGIVDPLVIVGTF